MRAGVLKDQGVARILGEKLNPSGIEQQAHGGLAEAISLVLTAGLTIKDGDRKSVV